MKTKPTNSERFEQLGTKIDPAAADFSDHTFSIFGMPDSQSFTQPQHKTEVSIVIKRGIPLFFVICCSHRHILYFGPRSHASPGFRLLPEPEARVLHQLFRKQ